MTQNLFYQDLYLKSLTPFEILKFRKENNISLDTFSNNPYVEFLKQSLDKDCSDEVLKKYCNFNHFSDADIISMTSRIDGYDDDIILPVWIKSLKEVLDDITIKTNYEDEKPFYHLLLPFIDFFSSKLTQKLKNAKLSLPKKDIKEQLILALYNDLFEISHRVLLIEFDNFKKREGFHWQILNDSDVFYKKFVLFNLKNGFQNLFLDYPMLARKIMTKTHRYIDFIVNMFERLEIDRNDIESCFNLTIQQITKIDINLGDQHNGASTTIIEFENQNKIVYKPSNVSITNAYNQLLSWINKNLNETLKTFKVVDKKDYGWLQFVEYTRCDSIDDIRLYYEKAGILLGIAYFLNANDFHFENIISSGNSPVLIDHETIVSPKLKTLYKGEKDNKNDISGTILETSLLPMKGLILPYYMYGYGSSTADLESKIDVFKIKNPNKDTMILIPEIEIRKNVKSNKPIYNDRIENVIDYEIQFKRGFKRIYNLVLINKDYLLSSDSPINSFNNLTIRFINRPTNVYYKILKLLNKSEYLIDSLKYGIKLEILARAYLTSNNYSVILNSEREQMLLGDIPVFYINTSDNTINLSNDRNIEIIELNAIENIYNKIRKASLDDFNNQMALISDSIEL